MKFILIYIVFINLLLFSLMGIDKEKAKLKKWRISEKTLFLLALFGGGIGGVIGIYTFRHKTKHLKFTLGFPIIIVFQLIVILLFFNQ
ncbi:MULTISPECIES: DUF1294 domain-containing protein [unclassified Clostridium]|uniref:DUF1294 domain-containing protein n=1 Tax=Clostridium TaxID=1485 RepID=UPI001C8C4730|nr:MULTISPECIES: DUF1294 domain-containing protein [unclassified Clostridium]MBX9135938.1 DUF1294 domain-containing protein [Clostridium sp. K12(2020)]MBX9142668.1 DUF1294 domain-containing protein [Clostridium sp. K13]MDU2291675.1 DUF1294 domain-containing protein [Clostridium celatum]